MKRLECIKMLCNAKREKKAGNHKKEKLRNTEYYYYHNNLICWADSDTKTYKLDFCGHSGSISTKDALANYREFYNNKGFTQVEPIKIYNYED